MRKTNLNEKALASQRSSGALTTEKALASAVEIYQSGNLNNANNAQIELFYFKNIIADNPKLNDASPDELVKIFLAGARLQLTFDPTYQFLHVVPYWSGQKNRNVPNMQIGYKGMEYLMKKSGLIKQVVAHDLVYAGEQYVSKMEGGEITVSHTKNTFDRDKSKGEIGGYILVKLYNDSTKLLELSKADFDYARSKSKSWAKAELQKESLWATNRDAMCKKTLWRRLYSELLADLKIAQDIAIQTGNKEAVAMFNVIQEVAGGGEDDVELQEVEAKDAPPEVQEESVVAPATDDTSFDSRKKALIDAYKEAGIPLSVIKTKLAMGKNDLFTVAQIDKLDDLYALLLKGQIDKIELSNRIGQ